MDNLTILDRVVDALKRAAFLPDNTLDTDEYVKCIEDIADSGEIDSILFISGLVELEKEFDIEFPDEYLGVNFFSSIEQLVVLINELIKKRETD